MYGNDSVQRFFYVLHLDLLSLSVICLLSAMLQYSSTVSSTLSCNPRQTSASQGYGRVSFSAVWLLMPVRHKPLSRLTGCGRLIRIIAPPVPLFSATRAVGSPLYSIRGREEVSLCPCRLIAPCLPHRDDEMRLSLGLCHLRAASSAAPGFVPVSSYEIVNVQ